MDDVVSKIECFVLAVDSVKAEYVIEVLALIGVRALVVALVLAVDAANNGFEDLLLDKEEGAFVTVVVVVRVVDGDEKEVDVAVDSVLAVSKYLLSKHVTLIDGVISAK